MKKIGFGKLLRGIAATSAPSSLQWQPNGAPYPRLLGFDAVLLDQKTGVYAIWHLGVRPQWLRVGAAADLGAAVRQLAGTAWVMTHEGNAGIFLAWAPVPVAQGVGYARDLAAKLTPAFQHEPFSADVALNPDIPRITCPLPPGAGSAPGLQHDGGLPPPGTSE